MRIFEFEYPSTSDPIFENKWLCTYSNIYVTFRTRIRCMPYKMGEQQEWRNVYLNTSIKNVYCLLQI